MHAAKHESMWQLESLHCEAYYARYSSGTKGLDWMSRLDQLQPCLNSCTMIQMETSQDLQT
jgi:hypothetical protein